MPEETQDRTKASNFVVITGMSGAGRSTALKILEDLGFEAVDNLPLPLLSRLAAGDGDAEAGPGLAVGIDVRSRDFDPDRLAGEISKLTAQGDRRVRTLFLDCEDGALIRRYAETRRRHPLATDRPVADGLSLERALLSPLRDMADLVIDSTDLTIWDLKRRLGDAFSGGAQAQLAVTVTSFSYRRGLPREADLVFDVRFLRNPHYDPDLRAKTGQDPEVGTHIMEDLDFDAFWTRLTALLDVAVPRYETEGKSYLTIAFGCTGGKHRSVYLTERVSKWLQENGRVATVMHRDLARDVVP